MAKSPFAVNQSHTYTYPEPLDGPSPMARDLEDEIAIKESIEARAVLIDPEVMEDAPDGRPWLTIRVPKAAGLVDKVADLTASTMLSGDNGVGLKFEQKIAHANRGLFELLAKEWSFERACNGAAYSELDDWAADWVRACIADAVSRGSSRDFQKSTQTSSNGHGTSPVALPEPEKAESVSE